MLFNSIEFAIFFPLVCALFFTAPLRARVPLLLVASCVFYMFFIPAYIVILFVTIGIDYTAGIYISRTRSSAGRRAWLIGSILSTCAVLFVFKYYNFFIGTFNSAGILVGYHSSLTAAHIILPIGLSFHTFQSLSYVVEVYRGKQQPEYNAITYATYVMFFPQLVAGPIERPQNLLHQFRELQPFEYDRVTAGLKRMAWGFFKKLVVADRLALYVNDVYGSPRDYNGLQLTLGTFFFAYQIYCDFSAYSDIALGSAQVLGFKLMENFDTPYYSRSVGEFWRRWHISLSSWFKDYVYIPLGGSRVGRLRWVINILVTFGVSGLWHGANWTYVVWGLLNGVYLIFGEVSRGIRTRCFNAIGLGEETVFRKFSMLSTTFVLTCFAWVIFRAKSLTDATYVLTHWFRGWNFSHISTEQFLLRQLPAALLSIVALELGQLLWRNSSAPRIVVRLPMVPRWATYLAFTMCVIMFGVYRKTQFIYFQF